MTTPWQEGKPMIDCMTFPDTVEEFMEQYKTVDTGGTELVPIFRMKQWFEHLSQELDTISRNAAIERINWWFEILSQNPDILIDAIKTLPSVPPKTVCVAKVVLSDEQMQEAVENAKNEILQVMSSAEPEIIRCKDCKHRPFDGEDAQGFGVEFPDEKCPCQCDDGWYNWRPNNEWFCANAERRSE